MLGRVEAGELVKDVCRDVGICENTYYRWKAKFGGMDVSEARRLKELGLAVRRKKRKRVAQANRKPRVVLTQANEQWSMDFMSGVLANGRKIRTLKYCRRRHS